ncbi:major facilitator superfamily domain-containing protein [Penicillium daleae]|uniref:Major facilitator superfamily domain-containing protein n=1 Tax=Penicillium daleae TaxID=63821 RepID=A0AAD6C4A6_9EURO|nr:major facilitator superfamily domain-containing protein [Penicillium daleae]KAJ5449851.1 major facilitator superfamily domain-containing protein [Penicillium daleae]
MLETEGSSPPSVEMLTGWILRLLYMRMTSTPYPTWLASSNIMHMLETSGIHRLSHQSDQPGTASEIATRERLVGVAQHLNLWISFDLGLTRVSFQDEGSVPPSEKFKGYAHGVLSLWPISASLDPANENDGEDLNSTFVSILQKVYTHEPEILAQCNLVLCMMRRLHPCLPHFEQSVIDRVLALLQSGLESARGLLNACCPWHHIANVPFHTLYVLLVLDTRASVELISETMGTICLVASMYITTTMREATHAAKRLVLLYHQRRTSDVTLLGEALSSYQEMGFNEHELYQTLNPWPTDQEIPWLMDLLGGLSRLEGMTFGDDLFVGD